MAFTFELDGKGYLKKRESFNLEYKRNFQLGDNLFKYLKTLVGMANNKGGQIVFGVEDSPHLPSGMSNQKLSETDPKEIDSRIREYFSPEISWNIAFPEFQGNSFGILSVEEATVKPVVCKKNKSDVLREGAIYYRYRGETKEIEYPELNQILEKEREKERLLWIKHIEKISMVGPSNVHILDTYNGEISYGDRKILLDKTLIDKLTFIKEGHFTEKEGEGLPTLKLVGTIEGLIDVDNAAIDPNVLYPYTTKQLKDALSVNNYQIQAIIYCLDLKNKPKRHTEIKQGAKSNPIHKYSKSVVDVVEKIMKQRGRDEYIQECVDKYKEKNKH
ncbi:MAG: ATP-binding protein [Bacteroidales bacterium]|nr:ATP-binding protein [Bacteroidales bacterium]